VAASRYVVEIACIHLVVAQCSGFTIKWSIEKTIAGGFGCTLAVLVLISLLSYQALHNFTEAARRTTQIHEVLTKLEEDPLHDERCRDGAARLSPYRRRKLFGTVR
jgi:hypothetical protein